MIEHSAPFYSDGLKLDGSFFTDEEKSQENLPVVIACSGFTGLKNIHPERFARAWTKFGFTVYGFDYRGFRNSEGERNQVLIEEQVRDIANAVSFVKSTYPNRQIILAGWGMGGGLVLDAAKINKQVNFLIAMNGFYDAKRVQIALRGESGYNEFLQMLNKWRESSVNTATPIKKDPFDIYPLDEVSKGYVDNVLRKNPDYGLESNISFADSLLSFAPEKNLSDLADIPLFIAHGAQNALHPVDEPKSLKALYPGEAELFLLSGGGHTEWMLDDSPLFQEFSTTIANWMLKQCQVAKVA